MPQCAQGSNTRYLFMVVFPSVGYRADDRQVSLADQRHLFGPSLGQSGGAVPASFTGDVDKLRYVASILRLMNGCEFLMKNGFVALSLLYALPAFALDPIQCKNGTALTGTAPPTGTQQQCVLPDGTLHGEQRVWYSDGKLMEQRHFDHGKEHGEQQAWWPNGKQMMKGVAVAGKRYSGFKYWDVAGRPTKIGIATIPEKSLPVVKNPVHGKTP